MNERELRRKTVAAALVGVAIALVLAYLPWTTVDLLMRHDPAFRRWATPRLVAIRLGWCAFSASFGLLVGVLLARRKSLSKPKTGWDEPEEQPGLDKAIKECLSPGTKADETLLGMAHRGRKVAIASVCRESHMQVVGPTRSGKSQLLFALAAQDMRRGMPVFFMEAKGDHSDFDQFLALASLSGRGASVCYFNPQDKRSMTFNPIRALPGQDSTALANQIARVIGREPTCSGEGQDYYRSVDYAKIQNMAEVFWHTGKQFTLRDCFYYFNNPECREQAFRLCSDPQVAAIAHAEFEQNKEVAALTSAIRPWTTGPLGELLNVYSPQIRLEEVFEGRQLAYFAIPIGHLQVLANPLGRMLISGLLSIASWRQQQARKPGAATVILDEFAEFATPAFASFIATVGSARMWTVLSHQDLGQLKKVQGMDAEAFNSAVFNNTSGCKVCFRTPDPEDAEFWSSMLGTFPTHEDTERVSRGFLGVRRTGEMSRRLVEHFKIHPNKLKNLPPGTALVFSPGREESLVRTARVHQLISAPPTLISPAPAPEEGLNLAAYAKPAQPTVSEDARR